MIFILLYLGLILKERKITISIKYNEKINLFYFCLLQVRNENQFLYFKAGVRFYTYLKIIY